MRRGLLALLAVFVLASLAASCRSGEKADGGVLLTERWLRVGEDLSTEVSIYDGKLPPDLVEILNPGASTDASDKVQIPVHPGGKLIGSYVVRKAEGPHLVWLIYDVAEAPAAVVKKVHEQLDARPWQVIGAQADGSGTLLRFQTSTGSDLQGTAIVNQRPASDKYALVVDRGGKQQTLQVARNATIPELAAALGDDLTVKRVEAGAAKAAGLKEGDRILKVGDVAVSDRKSLASAQRALADEKTPSTSVTYVVQIQPSADADKAVFVEPPSQALPDKFPLKGFFDGLIVTEFQWLQQAAGSGFSASAITKDGSTAVTGRLRDALKKDGWQIMQDLPSGGSTQLQFQHSDGRSGLVEIGPFESDSAYTHIALQVETGQSGGAGGR
ncbi:MAG: hypothetical protein EPO16_05160 [Dehalococcoidia bacterium]|nr:MAG: hypothetical protein EPO16_05160 [Dehalococcoidia bacterium]